MGKILSVILVGLILIFFLLPLASGASSLPQNLSATETGRFIGQVLKYWLGFLTKAVDIANSSNTQAG